MIETICLSRMLNRSDSTYHISLNFFVIYGWYVILYSQLSWAKELFKCAFLTMYPKIAKLRWMLLFGNNLNKFTYNCFIITIQGVTTMVTCNYHVINFHVYFLLYLKIFVFTPIGEGKNKFMYKKGLALNVLSFYHKFNICIIVVITNCV